MFTDIYQTNNLFLHSRDKLLAALDSLIKHTHSNFPFSHWVFTLSEYLVLGSCLLLFQIWEGLFIQDFTNILPSLLGTLTHHVISTTFSHKAVFYNRAFISIAILPVYKPVSLECLNKITFKTFKTKNHFFSRLSVATASIQPHFIFH